MEKTYYIQQKQYWRQNDKDQQNKKKKKIESKNRKKDNSIDVLNDEQATYNTKHGHSEKKGNLKRGTVSLLIATLNNAKSNYNIEARMHKVQQNTTCCGVRDVGIETKRLIT